MKKQLGFLIDSQKCMGCYSCVMACKNQYHQPVDLFWRKIYPLHQALYPHTERAFYSLACNHCESPACAKGCPAVAYEKDSKTGIVKHHFEKCIGCGNCIRLCPFGAPSKNPITGRAEKCGLCKGRLDQNLKPACVQGCPVDAIKLIEINQNEPSETVPFPDGFPNRPDLNPSIRFILPKTPKIIKKT